MTQKLFVGIIVNGEQLALALASGSGDKCLDFVTGSIVPASECPEKDIGEGRPGLRKGKRFIRIPNLDEICTEWKARYDDWEYGDYKDNDELLPQTDEAEEVREMLWPWVEHVGQQPKYQEWCKWLNAELSKEATALRWIANLRPAVMVGWSEEGLGVTSVYDPAVKEWVDAM